MFSAWMIGFLLLMSALVWVSVVLGLPEPFLGLVVLAVLVVGGLAALMVIRRHRPARRPGPPRP